ncbi:MAG: T9SS type A sorting domain-containing protein [Flavobacteriales bacterium]|nr:T9SS type A sorting domain-containing protein [Flavobacteriales bacterium]
MRAFTSIGLNKTLVAISRVLTLSLAIFLFSGNAISQCGHISSIKIYDQNTDQEVSEIGPITNGMDIELSDLPSDYYLTVETEGNIESVKIWLNGEDQNIENIVPYTWPNGAQYFNSWNGGLGSYELKAKAYKQNYGNWLCDQWEIQFNIVENNCVEISAGTLTSDQQEVCFDGSAMISATPNGDINIPDGYSSVYVLTQGEGLVIVGAGASPEFTVEEPGNYTIHTLVYDPATLDLGIVVPGQTTGFDVYGLIVPGGGEICASLDVAGAPIQVSSPDAGTLSANNMDGCLIGGSATISATPNGDIQIPEGYSSVYVLTQGEGLVIVGAGADPEFTVEEEGVYTIHTLVYNPATLDLGIVVPGVTTGFDVYGLIVPGGGDICASLDVAGASFDVTAPDAGTLTSDQQEICFDGSATISATPNGDINVPDGYSSVYVLTQGEGLVIVGAGASPEFTVEEPGNYTIHTLVYDPATLDLGIVVPGQTTGFDVYGLIVPGGGEICASLDVAGAPIQVSSPDAGTLSANNIDGCLIGGSATISATPNGDSQIPEGYSSVYVLTQGEGLVIVGAGADPEFTVEEEGMYTIHTLVYNPATLDLGIVVPGVTTGFDVYGLIVPGGGEICASLDVPGAEFNIEECPCAVDAGTVEADQSEVCLYNEAALSATPAGDAIVPAGYSVIYVLTQGSDLVIVNAGADPEFSVDGPGIYTIHTLVYDPATLDLGIVVPGQTTGFDVFSLITAGGGDICAALDVAGAQFIVQGPDAGDINPDNFLVCLDYGSASLNGIPQNNAVVPNGYEVVYVLTRGWGLTIVNAGATPNFEVSNTGLYRIHTLVYDPSTLDLGIVDLGVTTGFDVNGLLVQGGGEVCASLDVLGAAFYVAPNWFCEFFGSFFRSPSINDIATIEKMIVDGSPSSTSSAEDVKGNGGLELVAFPNPVNDILNVSLSSASIDQVQLMISDMTGRIVHQDLLTVQIGQNNLRIDVNDLAKGAYNLRINSNTDLKSLVLIVE